MPTTPIESRDARCVFARATATLALFGCCLLAGCGGEQPAAANASEAGHAASSTSVALTESQLVAIEIQPVGTYAFAVERDALGNIDFDEDLAVVQAESALVSAAANYQFSSKALARVQGLYDSNGGVTQKELEQAISDHESAAGALKAARDAVRVLGKSDAYVDRVIATRTIEGGSAAIKWMVAYVTESDTPLIREGQSVQVRVAALDRAFTGKVSKIYAVVDPTTHRSKIRCAVEDPGNDLRPGMLATLKVRVQEPVEATALPEEALVREGDGSVVAWVTKDRHTFEQRVVSPGLRRDGRVQILAGLDRGELAVTQGSVFLSNLLQAPPSD